MLITCSVCGSENPEGARFCSQCGSPVPEAGPAPVEERRIVSILFVDMVGFTARSDHADPEDVRRTLVPFHELAKAEIERHGGTLDKFIGDAAMGVFGAPIAHEDDPERAVRAALRIQEGASRMMAEDPTLQLSLRVAVNTGEAVVAFASGPQVGENVAGDVVNTASRLQSLAPPGRVVVGEATYRAARRFFDHEPMEPVTVKGKAEPLRTWLVVGPRSRVELDVEGAPAALFVGRRHEMALLESAFAEAVRESSARLVTVIGEPGIGKSRLVSELRGRLDALPDPVWWRVGRCRPYGDGITYWAFAEVVKAQAGIIESDGPEAAAEKLTAAVAAVDDEPEEREWIRSRLAPLIGLAGSGSDGAAGRDETFAAWLRFLQGMTATAPLVVVFEDLQWAEPAMLELVEHLAEGLVASPVLLLATTRPELLDEHPTWCGRLRNSTEISLPHLSDDDTASLIRGLVTRLVVADPAWAALLRGAGGNPLFALEFVRMLADTGRSTGDGADIPVPDSVHALIAARLDILGPAEKARLHDASVVGQTFWRGALASMADVTDAELDGSLAELIRKELAQPVRDGSITGESEFVFSHGLIREVAYRQIPRASRARRHRAAGMWIESLAGGRLADRGEALAYHYGQALELTMASGGTGDVEDLRERARRFLMMAGDRALLLEPGRGEDYLRRAEALTPPGHPDHAALSLKIARAGRRTGSLTLDATIERLEVVLEEFLANGDRAGAGEALVRLSMTYGNKGIRPKAQDALRRAFEILEAGEPTPALALAYAASAEDRTFQGAIDEALGLAERAVDLADRLGAEDVGIMARELLGNARCELGDRAGLDLLHEALRMALDAGNSGEAAVAYSWLGEWAWQVDGPASGLETLGRCRELAERRGIRNQIVWAKAESTWMLFDAGDWDELLRVAAEAVEGDRIVHGGGQPGAAAATFQALVQAHRGDLAQALAALRGLATPAREMDPQVTVPALGALAFAEHASGNAAEALDLLREIEEATRGQAGGYRQLQAPDAVRIAVAEGDLDLAERFVSGSVDAVPRRRLAVQTGETILAEARGDTAGAFGRFEDLSRAWAEYGHPLERGRALLGAGRCLLQLSREVEAAEPLRSARSVFEALGATSLAADADGLLETTEV